MIWLPIGIVIGVVVTLVGGLFAMCAAGHRTADREIGEGWRRADFTCLVGMECRRQDEVDIALGSRDIRGSATWIYARSMRVDPKCLPDDLFTAARDFAHALSGRGFEPGWVQYLLEEEA